MQINEFWSHWNITEDPFRAEEARHDPVFARLSDSQATHPDYQKVFGDPARPSAAVVFGNKGSGKTALRLLLEKRLLRHNEQNPNARAWIVRYDDQNPILDRFVHVNRGTFGRDDGKVLDKFRLADHQDAILSNVVTRLVDWLTEGAGEGGPATDRLRELRKIDRDRRADLAVLVALYDQPRSGSRERRWSRLRGALRLGGLPWLRIAAVTGVLLAVAAIGMGIVAWWTGGDEAGAEGLGIWFRLIMAATAAGAIICGGFWAFRSFSLALKARKACREIQVVERSPALVRRMLGDLPAADLTTQPIPTPGDLDCRYQLTDRLLDVLGQFGYTSLIVLFDRIDEPALINGDAEKMRAVVWPLLNNKFLQQDRLGVKLLLPIELRHMLGREGEDFFQRARLDKQHMVDRLAWTGAALYDLCCLRLAACTAEGASPVTLRDLFEEDVTRQDLIDALDQMQQPRDAFKFLYQTIQEHCSNVSGDEPQWRVPRLTLQHIRKQQHRRVTELGQGVAPA